MSIYLSRIIQVCSLSFGILKLGTCWYPTITLLHQRFASSLAVKEHKGRAVYHKLVQTTWCSHLQLSYVDCVIMVELLKHSSTYCHSHCLNWFGPVHHIQAKAESLHALETEKCHLSGDGGTGVIEGCGARLCHL